MRRLEVLISKQHEEHFGRRVSYSSGGESRRGRQPSPFRIAEGLSEAAVGDCNETVWEWKAWMVQQNNS